MENQRLLLFLALSLVVLLLWEAWHKQDAPGVASNPTTQQAVSDPAIALPADTPVLSEAPLAPKESDSPEPIAANAVSGVDSPKVSSKGVLKTAERVRVITDLYDVEIDTVGGDLRRVFLLKYPVNIKEPNNPYQLLSDNLPQLYVAQTGLLSKTSAPDHHAVYQTAQTEYRLGANDSEVVVPFTWQSPDGLKVTKTYTFKRNAYLISIDHNVVNNSKVDWTGRLYRQFQRNEYDEPGKSRFLYTFSGAAVSTKEKPYTKIEFKDMAEWHPDQSFTQGGWAAILQHYFVSAWVPDATEVNHFFTRSIDDARYIVGMTGAERTVAANATGDFSSTLYVGPKEQHRLEKVSDNLKLVVDYGWLAFIAQPLFWLLEYIHKFVGNWGWSIILLTVMIKLAFYKLSETSYRSMANMRKLAPKFQSIRERYSDDRQRMSSAMMEIYKKEKVNPLSGCWPMLVQIPVFIALYWMLLESVELRQADFILWIHDLSTKDPYYVLPLLMGVSMYIQQKLSANPSLDPMHQKIMQYMPIVFTLFFMLFPAGLVLYWVVNNVLSITQQWYITRKIEKASK